MTTPEIANLKTGIRETAQKTTPRNDSSKTVFRNGILSTHPENSFYRSEPENTPEKANGDRGLQTPLSETRANGSPAAKFGGGPRVSSGNGEQTTPSPNGAPSPIFARSPRVSAENGEGSI